jgi:hypothetical protein
VAIDAILPLWGPVVLAFHIFIAVKMVSRARFTSAVAGYRNAGCRIGSESLWQYPRSLVRPGIQETKLGKIVATQCVNSVDNAPPKKIEGTHEFKRA